ncbi:MAG: hypothetical protein CMJ32_11140 [Phycisphaerae bacterium]|nr:hypothetical protein [Phycisphaerae bacterium]
MNVVSLLARIVFLITFLPTGWNMIMTHKDFTAEQGHVLKELGVQPENEDESGDEMFKARKLNQMALLFHENGIANARAISWTVAIGELVIGVLALPGLFTRLLGAMVLVLNIGWFCLISLQPAIEHAVFGMDHVDFTNMILQLCLACLGMSLVIIGGGAMSLDRMIFRRHDAIDPSPPEPDDA